MSNHLKSILIAEDDQNDLELMMLGLSEVQLANEVITVSDGEEALDYLNRSGSFHDRETGNPAVVLLDLKMPKVDGIEVLKHMKSCDSLKHIPVIILTSSKEEPDIKICYELEANAYVVKPVDFRQFIDAIKNIGMFWALLNEAPSESKRFEQM